MKLSSLNKFKGKKVKVEYLGAKRDEDGELDENGDYPTIVGILEDVDADAITINYFANMGTPTRKGLREIKIKDIFEIEEAV